MVMSDSCPGFVAVAAEKQRYHSIITKFDEKRSRNTLDLILSFEFVLIFPDQSVL